MTYSLTLYGKMEGDVAFAVEEILRSEHGPLGGVVRLCGDDSLMAQLPPFGIGDPAGRTHLPVCESGVPISGSDTFHRSQWKGEPLEFRYLRVDAAHPEGIAFHRGEVPSGEDQSVSAWYDLDTGEGGPGSGR